MQTSTMTSRWYCCGPTVYDHAHIGHARTYVAVDMLRRLSEPCEFVMNITDVDDKILARGVDPRHFEAEFWADMDALDVRRPDRVLRVTEMIPEIIAFIQRIIENGYAYEVDGNVWFDVAAYRAAGFTYAAAEDGEGEVHSSKKARQDFALWKRMPTGWESPWDLGRPGWHIECSVMASHAFDFQPLDVHAGGIDLAFPHHQNEVAQVNAYHGRDVGWVGRFLHTGHVHIDGAKMSKSLKNFITVRDMLKQITGRQARLLFAQRLYSDPMTFTPDLYEGAIKLDRRIADWLQQPALVEGDPVVITTTDPYNIPEALTQIRDLLETPPTVTAQTAVRAYLGQIGIDYTLKENPTVDRLIGLRSELRAIAKQTRSKALFAVTDTLRQIIKDEHGVEIVDMPSGNTIRLS